MRDSSSDDSLDFNCYESRPVTDFFPRKRQPTVVDTMFALQKNQKALSELQEIYLRHANRFFNASKEIFVKVETY